MARHLLTISGMPSVRFFFLGDNKLSAVSDGALELLQQNVSDLNRSKRQLFLSISAADEKC